ATNDEVQVFSDLATDEHPEYLERPSVVEEALKPTSKKGRARTDQTSDETRKEGVDEWWTSGCCVVHGALHSDLTAARAGRRSRGVNGTPPGSNRTAPLTRNAERGREWAPRILPNQGSRELAAVSVSAAEEAAREEA